ncbi:hypothetical protein ACFLZP_02275 [Patescibacteria group bacterium]
MSKGQPASGWQKGLPACHRKDEFAQALRAGSDYYLQIIASVA